MIYYNDNEIKKKKKQDKKQRNDLMFLGAVKANKNIETDKNFSY